MKRFLLPIALLSTISLSAFAAINNVDALNKEVQKILERFQNHKTKASLVFDEVLVNSERALKAKIHGQFKKAGDANTLKIIVNEISYEYGNGTNPTTTAKGTFGLDLTKLVSQEDINEMIPGLEKIIKDFSKSYTEKYGEAATVDARILEKKKNAKGDYTAVKIKLAVALDLSKLPSEINKEDVELKAADFIMAVEFKKGIALDGKLISNPLYKGFQQDQTGLKEMLEKLLSRDPEQLKEIEDLYSDLDRLADSLVNSQK